MDQIADIADKFGSGTIRLTVEGNVLVLDIPDEKLADAQVRSLWHIHTHTPLCTHLHRQTERQTCSHTHTATHTNTQLRSARCRDVLLRRCALHVRAAGV
jgi:sulfite reductase beta subunit-like hemoprotein